MAPSSQTASSSKRKAPPSASQPSGSAPKKVQLAFEASEFPGPVLAHFPSIDPVASTPFQLYRSTTADTSKPLEEQLTHLAGETLGVEFFSTNRDTVPAEGHVLGDHACRYLIGIHDPATNTLTITPSPTYVLAHAVKALANEPSLESSTSTNMDKRNKLGEAFGTKKAKSRIKTVERNKIDVAGMESVRSHIEQSITEGGKSLPTQEALKEMADESRPIPTPNMDAENPEEVYDIESIISPSLRAALKATVSDVVNAHDASARVKKLPWRHSNWVNTRLRNFSSNGKPPKDKTRMLLFISAMLLFQRKSKQLRDMPKMQKEMSDVPAAVLESLVSMFTETMAGSNEPRLTPFMEAKLRSYMFVLMLMVDGFSVETAEVAADLSLKPELVRSTFENLGCVVLTPSAADREAAGGISHKEAVAKKRAVLKTPVVFKTAKRGGPKR